MANSVPEGVAVARHLLWYWLCVTGDAGWLALSVATGCCPSQPYSLPPPWLPHTQHSYSGLFHRTATSYWQLLLSYPLELVQTTAHCVDPCP